MSHTKKILLDKKLKRNFLRRSFDNVINRDSLAIIILYTTLKNDSCKTKSVKKLIRRAEIHKLQLKKEECYIWNKIPCIRKYNAKKLSKKMLKLYIEYIPIFQKTYREFANEKNRIRL